MNPSTLSYLVATVLLTVACQADDRRSVDQRFESVTKTLAREQQELADGKGRLHDALDGVAREIQHRRRKATAALSTAHELRQSYRHLSNDRGQPVGGYSLHLQLIWHRIRLMLAVERGCHFAIERLSKSLHQGEAHLGSVARFTKRHRRLLVAACIDQTVLALHHFRARHSSSRSLCQAMVQQDEIGSKQRAGGTAIVTWQELSRFLNQNEQ